MVVISVVIPVVNEEKHIGETMDHLYAQDFKESFEILIMDGRSTDKTRDIVKKYQKKHKNIRMFDNPTGNTAIGRNIGFENAKGKFIMNYSAHATAEKNMFSTLAGKLSKAKKEIAAVGCANIAPKDKSFAAKLIGVVYASIFGGVKSVDQNASFKKDIVVPSVAFTLYRNEIAKKVKYFDPKFWCGQDFEMNYRINEAGYKILFTPETHVFRYNRSSLKKFARQMYRYGMARNFIIQKHRKSFRWPYIIPSIFMTYIVVGGILGIVVPKWGILYLLSLAAYILLGWLFSTAVTKNPLLIVLSPIFYFVEHFMYGYGFISGFFKHKF